MDLIHCTGAVLQVLQHDNAKLITHLTQPCSKAGCARRVWQRKSQGHSPSGSKKCIRWVNYKDIVLPLGQPSGKDSTNAYMSPPQQPAAARRCWAPR